MNKFLTLITLLLAFICLRGQETNNPDILKVIEKVELNTDREIYFNGEYIHFSATYFINGAKTKPPLSHVLYIELIDCVNNKPVIQNKYQINDFSVRNKIKVPFNVSSGNYILRAFTQYQRNLPGFKYSYKLITLLNPSYDPQSRNDQANRDSIYIAPEGGVLIDNIKNKVVIHIPEKFISDSNKYYIEDQNQNILKKLTPNSFGILQTEMVFKSSIKCNFIVETKDNDNITTPFPAVRQNGIQTSVSNEQYNVNYKIISKEINQNTNLKLQVLSNKFIEIFSQNISPANNSERDISITKSQLENGINYLILTNNNEIQSINTCYIDKSCNTVEIKTSKEIYKPKEKIDVYATVEDISHMPIASITVSRVGTHLDDHKYNEGLFSTHPILLENYLSSCKNIEPERLNQLLILTDNQIKKDAFNEIIFSHSNALDFIPETRSLTITGVLRNKKTKEPIPNQKVYLSVLFNNPQLHIYTTRENGEFIFSLSNVYEKNDIYLCSEDPENKEEEYELLVKSSFPSDIPDFSNIPLFITKEDMDIIAELYRNAQIQEKFQPKNNTNNPGTSGEFNLNDNKLTIDPDNYVDFENMEELFYEIVPNVIVKKDKDDYFFKVLDENDYMLVGTPLILVDHVPVFNANKIMKLNPAQIEKIEVLYKPYILGSHKINGVIILTTNTENFAEISLPKTSTFIEYKALEPTDYISQFDSNISETNNEIPDFRTTLYWNPALNFDTNEKHINFKASDSKGTYNIIVVGYNANGEKYYGEKQIKIE
ncbi:MAG: hypothetical protein KQH79_12520 [Bacteroidetes bacterium]|nr:hypothetical protein [Bacteroidota bacterium]